MLPTHWPFFGKASSSLRDLFNAENTGSYLQRLQNFHCGRDSSLALKALCLALKQCGPAAHPKEQKRKAKFSIRRETIPQGCDTSFLASFQIPWKQSDAHFFSFFATQTLREPAYSHKSSSTQLFPLLKKISAFFKAQ